MKKNRKERRSGLQSIADCPIIDLLDSDIILYEHSEQRSEKKTLENVSPIQSIPDTDRLPEFCNDLYRDPKSIGKWLLGCSEECSICDMSEVSIWNGNIYPGRYCYNVRRDCLFPRNFSIWYPTIRNNIKS